MIFKRVIRALRSFSAGIQRRRGRKKIRGIRFWVRVYQLDVNIVIYVYIDTSGRSETYQGREIISKPPGCRCLMMNCNQR